MDLPNQKDLIRDTDWDVLVILDACRYDYFLKVHGNYLEGDLKEVESPAHDTPSWLESVVSDLDFSDAIYITGNPHIREVGLTDEFYRVVECWDSAWNKKLGLVDPSIIVKRILVNRDLHPDRRIVVHFMQPHFPYISKNGGTFVDEIIGLLPKLVRKKIGSYFIGSFGKFGSFVKRVVSMSRSDPMSIEDVDNLKNKYMKNLRYVMQSAKSLVESVEGKAVITADHGELLGENGKYGHEHNHPLLKRIPWLEVE